MPAPLHERLRRLRRAADDAGSGARDDLEDIPLVPESRGPGGGERSTGSGAGSMDAAAPDLVRIERELLGETGEALSLRERLQRLATAAALQGARRAQGRTELRGTRLEEMVQGCRVENEAGEFFLIEDSVALDAFHGDVPLSRLRAGRPGTVAVLTGKPEDAGFDLADAVYLDTETTGLSGGAGTAAFLVGVGWVEDDRFRLRQYFMRDYHEEAALLAGLAECLARFDRIVTFNGRMFDVPLLETRYAMVRRPFPLEGAEHLDLLHPARRLWRAARDSCRLQALEAELLGVRRHGDVPGADVPQLYFDFVRRRDARALVKVFQHNRIDILSLAALGAVACQWIEEERAEHPADVFSLARVFERARDDERSEQAYRRSVELPGPHRPAALLRLAGRARRAGDFDTARSLWRRAADEGEWAALRALAVDLEHRLRDPAGALELVEDALERCRARPGGVARSVREDLLRRRERLCRKAARSAPLTPASSPEP